MLSIEYIAYACVKQNDWKKNIFVFVVMFIVVILYVCNKNNIWYDDTLIMVRLYVIYFHKFFMLCVCMCVCVYIHWTIFFKTNTKITNNWHMWHTLFVWSMFWNFRYNLPHTLQIWLLNLFSFIQELNFLQNMIQLFWNKMQSYVFYSCYTIFFCWMDSWNCNCTFCFLQVAPHIWTNF